MADFENQTKSLNGDGTDKILRRLGGNELYQSALHTLDLYRGTLVACRYGIPTVLRNPASRSRFKDTVQAAIAEVISKHPLLQVGVAGEDSKKPVWVRLDSIDMGQHIEWLFPADTDDSAVQEIIESQLNMRFTNLETRPGWRVVVLHPENTDYAEVVFAFNHTNADGMSGKIFHQDLLQSFNARGNEDIQQNGHIRPLPESLSRLPPLTAKWAKLSLGAPFVVESLWKEFSPSMLRHGQARAKWAPIRTSPYEISVRSFDIDNDVLSKVLTTCRQHETTVTGLLHGLALVSFASHLDASAAPAFAGGTAIDLRRNLPSSHPAYPGLIPTQTIGNYVSLTHHKFGTALVAQIRSAVDRNDPAKEGLSPELAELMWRAATKVRAVISNRLDGGTKNEPIGLLRFVGDWRGHMRDRVAKPRENSWEVTNLGVMDGGCTSKGAEQDETWALRRAQFGVGTEVSGAAVVISAMSVAGGQMRVACSWQDCVIDARLGERITADLERWLVQIGT